MRVSFQISNRALAIALLTGASFAAGAVIAAEFPSEGSELRYSGIITDSVGVPRATTETIQARLYDAATAGALLCAASESVDLGDTHGRFSVALPSTCAAALNNQGDAWAQVTVGTTTLARQKLGAVPFALVAATRKPPNCCRRGPRCHRRGAAGDGPGPTDRHHRSRSGGGGGRSRRSRRATPRPLDHRETCLVYSGTARIQRRARRYGSRGRRRQRPFHRIAHRPLLGDRFGQHQQHCRPMRLDLRIPTRRNAAQLRLHRPSVASAGLERQPRNLGVVHRITHGWRTTVGVGTSGVCGHFNLRRSAGHFPPLMGVALRHHRTCCRGTAVDACSEAARAWKRGHSWSIAMIGIPRVATCQRKVVDARSRRTRTTVHPVTRSSATCMSSSSR